MQDSPSLFFEKKLLKMAIFYLSKHLASEKQMRDYLKKKLTQLQKDSIEIEEEEAFNIIHMIILKLKKQGYIQDDLYLKGSVRSYLKKGLSQSVITYKLKEKGFESSQILQELQENGEDFELKSLLALMKKKKVGSFSNSLTKDLSPKEKAFFFRKGFSPYLIQKALLLSKEEIDEQHF